MDTLLALGAIVVAFVVVLVLLVRTRRLSQQVEDISDALRRFRHQAAELKDRLASVSAEKDALAETTFDPMFIVDAERRIRSLNSAALRLCDCDIGQSLIEATRSYELDSLAEEVIDGQRGELPLPSEFMLNNRLFRVKTSRLEASGGAVLVLRDVSELQRLGRARRDFVANISHELRTPLTAIRLLLDTLRMESTNMSPAQARLLTQISDQTDSLTQIAQELSDLTQIESGQMPMRLVRASLGEAAGSAIARLAPQAERAGLTLKNEIGDDVYALFDPEQIRRVLSNLLHNAIKFTPKGGATVFVKQRDEDFVTVGVRDTGVGIPHDELPRIFERFYKVDRARGQAGTGLGLSIAKHIVEAHGGAIWAEGTVGNGTTFYFTLPADELRIENRESRIED
jgi:two-component system phosphate regulon sensor histidine kinase PhoR